MPTKSGTIGSTSDTVVCSLVDGTNDVFIEISGGSTPWSATLGVKFSPDGGATYAVIDNALIQNVTTGATAGANGVGSFRVSLPGAGFVQVYCSSFAGSTIDIAISVGGAAGAGIGQSPALDTVFFIQDDTIDHVYNGMGGDAFGNVTELSITVPHASAPNSGTNLLSGLLPATTYPLVWAVFYDVPFLTLKYSGNTGGYVTGEAKPYALGSTLDVGPVPPEYLPSDRLSITGTGQLNTVINDPSGTALDVTGTNDPGKNSLYANPNATKGAAAVVTANMALSPTPPNLTGQINGLNTGSPPPTFPLRLFPKGDKK